MSEQSGVYCGELLTWYLARVPLVEGQVKLLDCSFRVPGTTASTVVRVASWCVLRDGAGGVWFHGSLSELALGLVDGHMHQFVGLYASSGAAMSEFIATAAHYDRYLGRLGFGHTVPLGSGSPLQSVGRSAFLLLDGGTYESFVPARDVVGGVETQVFAVIPISDAEWDVKKERGLSCLLDDWEAAGRDLFEVSAK